MTRMSCCLLSAAGAANDLDLLYSVGCLCGHFAPLAFFLWSEFLLSHGISLSFDVNLTVGRTFHFLGRAWRPYGVTSASSSLSCRTLAWSAVCVWGGAALWRGPLCCRHHHVTTVGGARPSRWVSVHWLSSPFPVSVLCQENHTVNQGARRHRLNTVRCVEKIRKLPAQLLVPNFHSFCWKFPSQSWCCLQPNVLVKIVK